MHLLRFAPIWAVILGWQSPAFAVEPRATDQSEATTKVLQVVQRFFDAMAARNPVACRATLAPEGQLQALKETAAGAAVSYKTLGDFAAGLSTWKERPLERIWNPTVLVQDRIATVWAPYDFHRDGKFSHSGIDVFTLMRAGDDWKIVSLAFTMQPHVPSQHPAGPPPSL
jgi:hypothetical protein